MRNDKVIRKLETIQRGAGLNDTEFGRILGVNRVHWNNIKNGRRGYSAEFLLNAYIKYPQLKDEVNDLVANVLNASQKSNKPILACLWHRLVDYVSRRLRSR